MNNLRPQRFLLPDQWLFLAAVALAAFAFAGGKMGDHSMREPRVMVVAAGMLASFVAVIVLGSRRRN